MNSTEPNNGFLEGVKELTQKNGAILIFDETITGFRYANGGAQEYFGVIPDLAVFGKGMANGYPVSAVTGRAEVMKLMEEVFFSFTFGGETLSLAAALTTMTKLQQEPVVKTLWEQGRKIKKGVNTLIRKHNLENVLSITGKDCWSFLIFKDTDVYSQWELKTLFLQEVFASGVLTLGTHNMSYAHSDEDISKLLKVYDEVFGVIKDVVREKSLDKRLQTKPLVPLFKIR
jgi:glutamate-1-semialdehyde 2,1-aminomutase